MGSNLSRTLYPLSAPISKIFTLMLDVEYLYNNCYYCCMLGILVLKCLHQIWEKMLFYFVVTLL